MFRFWVLGFLLCAPMMAAGESACGAESPEIAEAFDHLYSFNFPAAHTDINRYIGAHPREPLGYAISPRAVLFLEADRPGHLGAGFLIRNKPTPEKKGLGPDPGGPRLFS